MIKPSTITIENGEWKVQVKAWHSSVGVAKWKTLSKTLQKVHGDLPEDQYTIAQDLNKLVIRELPEPFSTVANILMPDNQGRLKASIQNVLSRVPN